MPDDDVVSWSGSNPGVLQIGRSTVPRKFHRRRGLPVGRWRHVSPERPWREWAPRLQRGVKLSS